jgi:two-component system sensor kinase FixL
MDTAAVWANEPVPESPARGRNEMFLVIGLAAVVLAAAVGGISWFYWTGLRALRTQAAQVVDKTRGKEQGQLEQIIGEANQWARETSMISTTASVAVLLVGALGGLWWHRRSAGRTRKFSTGTGERIQQLQIRLAEVTIAEETARKSAGEMEERFGALSNTHAKLMTELNERKLTEKSLAQQAQQLERSKDVLEMHVAARTQELDKLQRRNEMILNSAGEGICGFDLQGRATFVNPAAARISGCRVDEMIGKTEEEIFFPPRHRGAEKGPGLVKNEMGGIAPEQTFYRKDGTCFPVEYLRSPIRENNRTVGSVLMFKDITERKLADDALAHKAAELARSNSELEQFAFVASHDLQEPLRKIQAFGDRLKLKCDSAKLEEGRDYLDRMQSAAARMQTLINDLLTFSRVISAKQPFVPVDLASVTREVLGDLEVRIEKSGGQVTVGQLPTVEGDPTQLRQLLQNLIGNALKFQSPNAVPRVKVEAQLVTRDQIREGATFPNPPPSPRPDDRFCVLTVEDNGIGFEEQYLEKIFAVFQRLHGRSEFEGTGVGLAVCRRITDRHGGLITAQSKLGEGSTFIVILPLRQPKAEDSK